MRQRHGLAAHARRLVNDHHDRASVGREHRQQDRSACGDARSECGLCQRRCLAAPQSRATAFEQRDCLERLAAPDRAPGRQRCRLAQREERLAATWQRRRTREATLAIGQGDVECCLCGHVVAHGDMTFAQPLADRRPRRRIASRVEDAKRRPRVRDERRDRLVLAVVDPRQGEVDVERMDRRLVETPRRCECGRTLQQRRHLATRCGRVPRRVERDDGREQRAPHDRRRGRRVAIGENSSRQRCSLGPVRLADADDAHRVTLRELQPDLERER